MAHPAQQNFCLEVKTACPEYFDTGRVLDVGSQDINGSNRELFSFATDYLGIDIGPGKGVDIVAHCVDYRHNAWDGTLFDVVVSTEAMEHDERWRESMLAMYEMLAPGGLLLMTCAGPGREEHGTTRTTPGNSPHTTDYYGNLSEEDVRSVWPSTLFKESICRYVGEPVYDIHFMGIKR